MTVCGDFPVASQRVRCHAHVVAYVNGPNGKRFCTTHDVEFPLTRSCPQCAGPARLNLRDEDGQKVDPFPELTAALGPLIAENRQMAGRYRAIAESFASGSSTGESAIPPNATAAAAMYRLEAMQVREAHDKMITLADWRRVAALEERKRWSARPPANTPGPDAKAAEVH